MAEEKQYKGKGKKVDDKSKNAVQFSPAVPASVEEIMGRTGSRGEAHR